MYYLSWVEVFPKIRRNAPTRNKTTNHVFLKIPVKNPNKNIESEWNTPKRRSVVDVIRTIENKIITPRMINHGFMVSP